MWSRFPEVELGRGESFCTCFFLCKRRETVFLLPRAQYTRVRATREVEIGHLLKFAIIVITRRENTLTFP